MMEANKKNNGSFLTYLQCYLLGVGFMLGAGILGLPVTMARSGLTPFLISFTITAAVQIMLVYFVVDLLQKCIAVQLQGPNKSKVQSKDRYVKEDMIPLNRGADHYDSCTDDEGLGNAVPEMIEAKSPDLHMLGEIFLPSCVGIIYDIQALLILLTLAVSYALAGSQAYADLFGIRTAYTLPVFCWVLNVIILFGRQIIRPLVSILTFFKGTVLLVTVIVAFVVGSTIQREVQTDFRYIGQPFLMGTVVVVGGPLVMPFMYAKIEFVEHQIRYFRLSINMAIVTTYLLCVFWGWAVLDVVPQSNTCVAGEYNSSSCVGASNHTLLWAEENGLIATIPFKEVINENYPEDHWVAVLVTLFIVVSITVSYSIANTTVCHTVDGAVDAKWPKDKWQSMNFGERITLKSLVSLFICLVLLIVVFVLALLNPKGFVVILEKGVSLLMNSLFGIYFSIMIWRATGDNFSHLKIPLPLSKVQIHLQYSVTVFFAIAVGYDIVITGMDFAGLSHY